MVYLISSLLSTGEDTIFQNIISIPLVIPKFIQEVTKAPPASNGEQKFPKVPYYDILPRNPHININEEVYETNETNLENSKVEVDKEDINIEKTLGDNHKTGVNGYNVVCSSGSSQNIEELIQVAQKGKLVGEVNDENS